MTDKPANVISLKGLDLDSTHGPVSIPMPKGNGVITFPDFYDAPAEDVEEFLDDLNNGMATGKVSQVLAKWLPEKEHEKFRKAYPKYKAQLVICGEVLEVLSEAFGTSGEGRASEN